MTINIAKLLEIMGTFSVNAKSDKISVEVARITNKLVHAGTPFESHYNGQFSPQEQNIINLFIKQSNTKKAA